MTIAARIRQLRDKREFYRRLGKLKKLHMIDAELVPLVTEQVRQENLAETVRRDIELIGWREADDDLDAATEVYRAAS
jgi:hypothetical protein